MTDPKAPVNTDTPDDLKGPDSLDEMEDFEPMDFEDMAGDVGVPEDNPPKEELSDGANKPNEQGNEPDPITPAHEAGDNKNWEESAKYQQSRADKLQDSYSKVESLTPLADLMDRDPKVAEQIAQVVAGTYNQNGNVPPPQNTEESLELQAPVKPQSFDEYEGNNDPTSDSYKYNQAQRSYEIQVEAKKLFESQMKPFNEKLEQVTGRFQKLDKMDQQRQQIVQTKQQLMADGGLTAVQADSLITFLNSPESLNPLAYAKFMSGEASPAPENSLDRQNRIHEDPQSPASVNAPPDVNTKYQFDNEQSELVKELEY